MPIHVNSYAMPFSNLSHLLFPDKLKATRLAGYDQFSLMPIEVKEIVAAGTPIKDMVRMAKDQGLAITRLDPLNTWPRLWLPDNMDEAYIARVSESPDEYFSIAEQLGCTHASLNATFPLNAMTLEEITGHYAAICKRGREHGMIVDLEFIPLWGVPTLTMAWEIVRGADQSNGGLVFDVWHFVRSKSSLALLKTIPGSLIHCLQLNDGPLKLPKGVTVKDDCYNRFFPGDGEFPNVEIVRILNQTGGLNQVGPEVFSPMLAKMSASQVAKKSKQSVAAVIAAANEVDGS